MNKTAVKGRRRGSKSDISLSGESDQETTHSGNAPPFVPLEATTEKPTNVVVRNLQESWRKYSKNCSGKKVVSSIMFGVIGLIIWDAVFTDPDDRLLKPDFADNFLRWEQANPVKGILAFLLVIAVAVVLMIPIGTPLTLGCGYIYKAAYGWTWGLALATLVSMGGSALGAVCCFLLGRYLMRDQVRQWIRKYPLFDAIDVGMYTDATRLRHFYDESWHISHFIHYSGCRAWFANHGNALSDTHSALGARFVHVWNHIYGAESFCSGKGCITTVDAPVLFYRS